jgi:hypothetical protein
MLQVSLLPEHNVVPVSNKEAVALAAGSFNFGEGIHGHGRAREPIRPGKLRLEPF